jgi:hypothetical protein
MIEIAHAYTQLDAATNLGAAAAGNADNSQLYAGTAGNVADAFEVQSGMSRDDLFDLVTGMPKSGNPDPNSGVMDFLGGLMDGMPEDYKSGIQENLNNMTEEEKRALIAQAIANHGLTAGAQEMPALPILRAPASLAAPPVVVAKPFFRVDRNPPTFTGVVRAPGSAQYESDEKDMAELDAMLREIELSSVDAYEAESESIDPSKLTIFQMVSDHYRRLPLLWH